MNRKQAKAVKQVASKAVKTRVVDAAGLTAVRGGGGIDPPPAAPSGMQMQHNETMVQL